MSRRVIDVTQLVRWQGRLTGVPRVMHELSIRFADKDDTVFVEWDGARQKFVPVDLEAALRRREMTGHPAAQDAPAARPRMLSLLVRAVNFAKRRSAVARKLLAFPEKAARRLLLPAAPKPQEPQPAFEFKVGDLLVVLWGEWHDESFIRSLVDLKAGGIRLAQMAYDMLPLVTPQYSGHSTEWLNKYAREIYPICDVIIAISEHTRKDVAAWLRGQGLEVPEIEVMRLGDDFKFAKAKKPQSELFKKPRDFILCVGTIEARKNHALLYYVYKLARSRGMALPALVIVGRRGWKTDDIYELMTTDPDTKDQLLPQVNISDEELSWLYEHCLFSIYPSFYEGWGLPIAESAARGVPCVASNTSSMPEIAGDLIRYFDPASTDECLAAIELMMNDSERKKTTNKLKKYKPVSWDQTYGQVEKILGGIDG